MGVRVRTVALASAPDLLAILPRPDALCWVRGGEGVVGWGEALHVDAGTGGERFSRALQAFEGFVDGCEIDDPVRLPGTGPLAFASLTFDGRSSGSSLVVPEVVVGRAGGRAWVTTVDAEPVVPAAVDVPPSADDRVRYAGSSLPDLEWLAAVDEAVRRIDAGGLDKVVLARDHAVWSRAPFDPRLLLRRLAERFPDCWTFAHRGLVGATPELLVRRRGDEVSALVLAGTAARGEDADADAALGEALLGSDKDRHEHAWAVASVRDALVGVAEGMVEEGPSLLRLSNVQHLATAVRGRLAHPSSALKLAARLHPTAAVGGTPTDVAVATITELEGMDRGRYAGPVGWIDARGDGDFGIALRCAELSGARARLFAGAGIVAGSLPEAELEETRLKLRAMRSAFDA